MQEDLREDVTERFRIIFLSRNLAQLFSGLLFSFKGRAKPNTFSEKLLKHHPA